MRVLGASERENSLQIFQLFLYYFSNIFQQQCENFFSWKGQLYYAAA